MTNALSEIPWSLLHELTENAAKCAPSWPGGTGVYSHVPETMLGLAQLYCRAETAIHEAWSQLHKHSKISSPKYLREMVYFALAAGKLHRAVVEALGGEVNPLTICYVSDIGQGPQLFVQGIRWAWDTTDRGFVPAEAAEAFANGGSFDLFKAALDATAGTRMVGDFG